jgi:hypothetical protein
MKFFATPGRELFSDRVSGMVQRLSDADHRAGHYNPEKTKKFVL